jgi:hypothetical protein
MKKIGTIVNDDAKSFSRGLGEDAVTTLID